MGNAADPMQRLINEARHFLQDYERYANDEDRESPDPNSMLDAIAAAEAAIATSRG